MIAHCTIRLGIVLILLSLAGCASSDRRPPQPWPPPQDPRALPVYDARAAAAVDWATLVEDAIAADAVIIGETHGHPLGLACAAVLWEDILDRSAAAALSLEFFERDEQSRVDDYLAGLSSEDVFRKRTGRTEGNYPPGHRAMLEAAKAGGRRVYAANAPRAYVRLARQDGFERLASLTAEQRRLVRVPDELPTGRYRERFDELMGGMVGHGRAESDGPPSAEEQQAELDAMFRSQSLWDWTMAETIARAIEEGAAPVVHVVGQFHSDHDGGLVLALRSLRPGVRLCVVSLVGKAAGELREEDADRGDYVLYVGAR